MSRKQSAFFRRFEDELITFRNRTQWRSGGGELVFASRPKPNQAKPSQNSFRNAIQLITIPVPETEKDIIPQPHPVNKPKKTKAKQTLHKTMALNIPVNPAQVPNLQNPYSKFLPSNPTPARLMRTKKPKQAVASPAKPFYVPTTYRLINSAPFQTDASSISKTSSKITHSVTSTDA